jgi:hypothetical protein
MDEMQYISNHIKNITLFQVVDPIIVLSNVKRHYGTLLEILFTLMTTTLKLPK